MPATLLKPITATYDNGILNLSDGDLTMRMTQFTNILFNCVKFELNQVINKKVMVETRFFV